MADNFGKWQGGQTSITPSNGASVERMADKTKRNLVPLV